MYKSKDLKKVAQEEVKKLVPKLDDWTLVFDEEKKPFLDITYKLANGETKTTRVALPTEVKEEVQEGEGTDDS